MQNPPLAAFYHFGASLKAIIARFVTFEHFGSRPAIKTNISGSRPTILKKKEICPNERYGVSGPIRKNFVEGLPIKLEQ